MMSMVGEINAHMIQEAPPPLGPRTILILFLAQVACMSEYVYSPIGSPRVLPSPATLMKIVILRRDGCNEGEK